MLPPQDPPKLPTFPNRLELQRSIATVFEGIKGLVRENIGSPQQGVICVPAIHFIAHLDDTPPDENTEVSFILKPDTLEAVAAITNKVIMRDPLFIGAIMHSIASIMAQFMSTAGDMLKHTRPNVLPMSQESIEEEPITGGANVLPFDPNRPKKNK